MLQVVRPAAGGIRRHVIQLAAGLPERGWTVEVAAPPGFALEDAALPHPPPVHLIPIGSRLNPGEDLRAASILRRLGGRCDVGHAHGLRAAWVASLAFGRRKPWLFTAHNLAPPAGLAARIAVRTALGRAAAVVAVSRAAALSLAPLGMPPSRVHVIPNGVDVRRFARGPDRREACRALGVPESAPLVAALGRLSWEKGFDVLIAAAPRILRACPDARIVVAGTGPAEAELRAAAATADAAGRILLPGWLPDASVLLASADVAVVPSREEGQGIAALEAMGAGAPVVASRTGGLPETVVDGETGFLVKPGDPAALADAVLRVLSDEALGARMGQAGRRRAESEFNLDLMLDSLAALYSRLAPSTTA